MEPEAATGRAANTGPEPATETAPEPAAQAARREASPASSRLGAVLAVLSIVLMAACLRPAATSLGPVLAEVEAAFGLQGWQTGLLTALPGAAYVVFGAVAFLVLRRLGMFRALLLCVVAIAVGLLVRVLGDSWAAFAGFTTLALAGMAMGNVVLPVYVKARFPTSQTRAVTVFMMALGLGAALPTLLTAPAADVLGGWRPGLGLWAALPVLALVVWLALRGLGPTPDLGARTPASAGARPRPITASRGVWALTLYFGLQSLHAYVQFGWAAQIYRDAGLDPVTAGLMVTIIVAGGIPGGFIAPQIVARGRHVRPVLVGYAIAAMGGYAGLLLAPTTLPWLWAVGLAVGGFSFPSALALITVRTRRPEVTARTSGFVQPVGYLLAAVGPLLLGVVLEATGSWEVPLVALLVLAGLMGLAAWIAGAPGSVDAELEPVRDADAADGAGAAAEDADVGGR